MKSFSRSVLGLVKIVDILTLACVIAFCWGPKSFTSNLDLLLVLLLIPLSSSLMQYYGLYESHRVEGSSFLLRGLLSAQIACLSAATAIMLAAGMAEEIRKLGIYGLLSFCFLFLQRSLLYGSLRLLRRHGFDVRRVCVVGSRSAAEGLSRRAIENAAWGLEVAYWGDLANSDAFYRYADGELLERGFLQLVRHHKVDEVLILSRPGEVGDHKALLSVCKDYAVDTRLVIEPEPPGIAAEARREEFGGAFSYAVLESAAGPAQAAKRLIDILSSAFLLIVLSPLLMIVAILVKLSSAGPVFFTQRRMGLSGQHFTMYKFRTMVDGAEGMLSSVASRNITEGPAFKSRDDWRVTPAGHWLRRYSMDELPQLINVLRGDMSLVGPRPLPVAQALAVAESCGRRFSVRPGLTCFWQVSGRSDTTFASWMRMDLEYVDSWSLWLDTKLILRTIPAVFSGRGAY
jgi:exopolysaccharide biosynthesis polyprenyl glycosylphosphotransferase